MKQSTFDPSILKENFIEDNSTRDEMVYGLRTALGYVVQATCQDLQFTPPAACLASMYFHAVFPRGFDEEELKRSCKLSKISQNDANAILNPEENDARRVVSSLTNAMTACIFLAGKMGESPVKLRDCVNSLDFHQSIIKEIDSCKENFDLSGYQTLSMKAYWDRRDACLKEEARILHVLRFVFEPKKLYELLMEVQCAMNCTHLQAHLIWSIVNDVTASPILEEFGIEMLIIASFLVACKLEMVCNYHEQYASSFSKFHGTLDHDHNNLINNVSSFMQQWENSVIEKTRCETPITSTRNDPNEGESNFETPSTASLHVPFHASIEQTLESNQRSCFEVFNRLRHLLFDINSKYCFDDQALWTDLENICSKVLQNYKLFSTAFTL
ncbi:hypothetical protein IE077_004066 [Cardiosporidium cionae]|uniref:Cyclin N-terminal domain-containing protein n=1 Tax=Cardiosporidium cionae TaxID=476202 RepID=A0ABQ7J6W0_9APIC|nr:hypothetical protein IE077_004066 [Cardiosporidium cionae]|eukprot:KAF8819724.1 hypothetical protein IE077_004066 [Cardiosporidium cionae]